MSKSEISESGVVAFGNTVDASVGIFWDKATVQGGLYFAISSQLNIVNGIFTSNPSSLGMFSATGSDVMIYYSSILDVNIQGVSTIGTFSSGSKLVLYECTIARHELIALNDYYVSAYGFVVLYTSYMEVMNTVFTNISLSGAELISISSSMVVTELMTVQNVIKQQGDQISSDALIYLSQSVLNVLNVKFIGTSNIFQVAKSNVVLNGLIIENITALLEVQYLLKATDSAIQISNMNYTESQNSWVLTPVIEMVRGSLVLAKSRFNNVGNVFEPVISMRMAYGTVTETLFNYNDESNSVSIFKFDEMLLTIINSCSFIFAGIILELTSPLMSTLFTNNTIIAGPYTQSIGIEQASDLIIISNNIFVQGGSTALDHPTGGDGSIVDPQIVIEDPLNTTIIHNNVFTSFLNQISTLSISSMQYPYNVSLTNNIFINNQGCSGAAILLSESKQWKDSDMPGVYPEAVISSSIFVLNTATYCQEVDLSDGRGGAIYQTSQNSQTSPTFAHQDTSIVNNTVFLNNTARSNGGAIYFDYSPPRIDATTVFLNNYATLRLSHIASFAVRVVPFSLTPPLVNITYVPGRGIPLPVVPPEELLEWREVPSGLPYQQPCVFALLDMYNQVVFDDSSSLLRVSINGLSDSTQSLFYGLTGVTAQHGLYYYDNSIFTFRVGQQLPVSFVSTAVRDADYKSAAVRFTSRNSTTIQLAFRGCEFGEYLAGVGELNRCEECRAGYWSIGKDGFDSSVVCTECDHTSTFCLGGGKVGPKPGYWRMSTTADIVVACSNPDACIANIGLNPDDSDTRPKPIGLCGGEFTGNMCDKCVDGYGKINGSSCMNCASSVLQYLEIATIFLVQAALIIYGIKEVVDMTMDLVRKGYEESGELDGAILVRILVNYLQMISLISEVPAPWPTATKSMLNVNTQLSFIKGFAISTDCLMRLGQTLTGIRTVFLRALLVAVTPVVLILFSIIFWLFYFKLKRRPVFGNRQFHNQLVTTIVIICFNLQPNILQSCFQLFQCTNLYRVDTPMYFLTTDYDLQCWTNEHLFWVYVLAVPNLLLWGIGLPVFMFCTLRRHVTRLNSAELKRKYAYLYVGYKDDKYYWEFFILLRKLALICIVVFAGFHSVQLQIYLSVVLVVLIYVVQKKSRPYTDEKLNRLEDASLVSASLINFCAFYFVSAQGVIGIDIIIICVGIFGNIYFGVRFVRLFWLQKSEELRKNKHVMKVVRAVWTKCCCCLRAKSVIKYVRCASYCIQLIVTKLSRIPACIIGVGYTQINNQIKPEAMDDVAQEAHSVLSSEHKTPDNADTPINRLQTYKKLQTNRLILKKDSQLYDSNIISGEPATSINNSSVHSLREVDIGSSVVALGSERQSKSKASLFKKAINKVSWLKTSDMSRNDLMSCSSSRALNETERLGHRITMIRSLGERKETVLINHNETKYQMDKE